MSTAAMQCKTIYKPLPACLFENSHALVSLWQMLVLQVDRYIEMLDAVQELERNVDANSPTVTPQRMGDLLIMIQQTCNLFRLQSSAKQVMKIVNRSSHPNTLPYPQLHPMLAELRTRLKEDLEGRWFFAVSHENRNLFEASGTAFGESVVKAFPTALLDMEEAVKCMVFERNTACVFHLMRVVEIGIRALGASLNHPLLDPSRNPSWESILKKCDQELQKGNAERSPEWRASGQFYSEATANLRAVKDAWRNPTMHVEIFYDPERALGVFTCVKIFMMHLSTKLQDEKAAISESNETT